MSKSGSGDKAPAGLWEGHFEFRGQRVGMSVDFDAGALSIPQQGLTDHPIQGFAYDPPRLSFVLPVGGGVEFQGELTDEASGRRIAGTFRQAGADAYVSIAGAGRPELESLFRPSVQPFLISLFRYDPAVEISRLEIPGLIVNGSHDLQASEEETHLLAAARPEAELRIIEGVNHVLKRAPADPQGNFATYGDPSLPLDQEVLEAVGGFLRTRLRTDNPG